MNFYPYFPHSLSHLGVNQYKATDNNTVGGEHSRV